MNSYRLYCEAVKASSLGSDSILRTIACDRKVVLDKVLIVSRAGITANNTNYSKLQILNGATVVFERSFQSGDLDALTVEELSAIDANDFDANGVLQVKYVAAGTGLALDLDCELVFVPARA